MTTFKAAYYETIGKAEDVLKIGFFELEDPKENEVQIEIITSGINPSDVKTRQGARGPLQFPYLIPHSDGAGVIKKRGSLVTSFNIGDRVWMHNAAWMRHHGTASTLINLPEKRVAPLPEQASFELGACLGIPALTAAACVLSLKCKPDATIMVTGGAGSVGICAIQLAKMLGIKVISSVSSKEKEHIAKKAGADEIIYYQTENVLDKVKEYTNNALLDGMIDVDFGSNLAWSIDALKSNTTLATYASANQPHPILPFYALMFKQITIKPTFVYILPDENRKKVLELIEKALTKEKLRPVIHKIYSLDDIAEGHKEVESAGKIGQVLLKNSLS